MPRYCCEELTLPAGDHAVRLEDTAAGLDATVVPERGALWMAFGARDPSGKRVELLYPVDVPMRGGSPVLFPVVGRSLCEGEWGSYWHRGIVRPMPIHGFAREMQWRVAAAGANEDGAQVTCILSDSERTRHTYPYAFHMALTYRLSQGAFTIRAVVSNPGAEPLPFHLGYHPYFRIPILRAGDRGRCLLEVPAAATWELEKLCATGRRLPLEPGEGYHPARPLAGDSLDCVFADLQADESGQAVARLHDPDSGYGIEMAFPPAHFPVFVVYAPPDAPFACLEPWTGLPGGLGDDMRSGQMARRVAPGDRFEATVSVRVRVPGEG